jgi:uncharacterized protein YbaR (Trm112 family)
MICPHCKTDLEVKKKGKLPSGLDEYVYCPVCGAPFLVESHKEEK